LAARAWASRFSGSAGSAARPGLAEVDQQQQHEGGAEHHGGDGGGAGVVVLLELGDDQQRGDLRDHRHVAGDEDRRAVFAQGTGEGESEPGQQGRRHGGQDHAGEGLEPVCTQHGGRFFMAGVLAVQVLEYRLHGTHHERQADEGQGNEHTQRRERHLERQPLPDPAVGRIQRGERDAGHRRR